MGNRYRIFMGPVNFADGAMSEDVLAKKSLNIGVTCHYKVENFKSY